MITEGVTQAEANALADSFIKDSFKANWFINAYAYVINIFTLVPFLALMILVAALLTYSILKLRGIESINSLGAMFKIVGSFVWFSGLISAVFAVIIAFFVGRGVISTLPLVLFFVALVIRSTVFAIKESKLYLKQLEKQEAEQTEV